MGKRKEVVKVTDETLIQASLAGDRDAYKELVLRYQQLIIAVTFKIVGNYQDAEDVAQETFLKAYQALPGYRGDAKLSTWLVRLATNKALDHRRKQQRLAQDVLDEAIERLHANRENVPETVVLQNEDFDWLRKQLEHMPEVYRRALYQCYFEELSCREIAKLEGVPVKTIASRLYRGKRLLRKQPQGGTI